MRLTSTSLRKRASHEKKKRNSTHEHAHSMEQRWRSSRSQLQHVGLHAAITQRLFLGGCFPGCILLRSVQRSLRYCKLTNQVLNGRRTFCETVPSRRVGLTCGSHSSVIHTSRLFDERKRRQTGIRLLLGYAGLQFTRIGTQRSLR